MEMNNENIDEIIEKATKKAIKEFNKERIQDSKDKIFHNTKLLLENYNELKEHVNNAIDDAGKLKEEYLMELDTSQKDEIYILSIKRSKSKTLIMIAHIDMAMNILKKKQKKLGTIEKYNVLEMFYFQKVTYDDIVKKINCGINTPRRWINEMIKELGILLFGVEGIKFEVV